MSSKYRKRRRKKMFVSQSDVSLTAPHAIEAAGSPMGRVELFAYGPEAFTQEPIENVEQISKQCGKWPVIWVDMEGSTNAATVQAIGKLFNLHELALEDIVNLHQRAKVEDYNDQLFIVMRMANYNGEHLEQEQVCLVLGKDFVLTFQEAPGGDGFDGVRERIKKGHGNIRTAGTDYLMYALVDAIVDGYFPVLEHLGDKLEGIEDTILERHDKTIPARILELKRELLMVRRSVWPSREALNVLLRDELPHVSPNTKVYLRDCYDHLVRLLDLVETQRELCSDLMDLHLSSTSNRMNEVMKVLTMITLLFMPPTLVAGIYGMNFNTKVSPFNMPELDWQYGYIFALVLMLVSAIGVYNLAKGRGWMKDDEGIIEPEPSAPAQ